jgi:hypothetical protein
VHGTYTRGTFIAPILWLRFKNESVWKCTRSVTLMTLDRIRYSSFQEDCSNTRVVLGQWPSRQRSVLVITSSRRIFLRDNRANQSNQDNNGKWDMIWLQSHWSDHKQYEWSDVKWWLISFDLDGNWYRSTNSVKTSNTKFYQNRFIRSRVSSSVNQSNSRHAGLFIKWRNVLPFMEC